MNKITANGTWDCYANKWDINLSSINSHLIRTCGRLVEDYNSDIIIDINAFNKFLDGYETSQGTKIYMIGFRKYGVDGLSFINHRINEPDTYRSIMSITVEKEFEHSQDHIKITLNELTMSQAKQLVKFLEMNPQEIAK